MPGKVVFEIKSSWTWSDVLRWDSEMSIVNIRKVNDELPECRYTIVEILDGFLSHVVCQSIVALLATLFGSWMGDEHIDDDLFIAVDNVSALVDCICKIGSPDDAAVNENVVFVLGSWK